MTTPRKQAGFSFIELCIGIAILAILLSQAIPAMDQMKQRQRLQLVAQTVMTDLQQARSEAVQRATAIQLRFSRHAAGSCYILHTGNSGDCRCEDKGLPVCSAAGKVLKIEWIPSSLKLTVKSNVANMSFQARQGAVTSTGSIDIAGDNGQAIRQVVSIAGRVRSCAVAGAFGGLTKCDA